MVHYEPSADFVNRMMERVRSYEKERANERDRWTALLLTKRMRFALSTGALLLGILNLIRMASTLIAPSRCL